MRKALAGCFTVLPLTAVVLATCEKPVTTLTNEGKPASAVVQPRASVANALPSLSLTKTADSATVSAGSPIGFTLTVSNGGPGTAHNVALSDRLPGGGGLSWSVSPAVSGCSISAGVLSCRLGDVAAGAGASVHVASPTTARSCGLFSNTGTVRADSVSETQASATTTVLCPGLHLRVEGASGPGSNIGYTITVVNAGPGAAKDVVLTDTLPAAPGTSWSVSPAVSGCSFSSNALTCSLGDMAAFTTVRVHVTSPMTTAVCGSFPGSGPFVTSSSGARAVSDFGNSIVLSCPTGLKVTKTADAASVNAGSSIGFTITVTVGGPSTATGVRLDDGGLPSGPGISWSVSPAVAGCSISSGGLIGLHCSLGDLVAGTSVSVHVISPTTAASCGVYNNVAVAKSTNNSTDVVSNQASVQVICPPS